MDSWIDTAPKAPMQDHTLTSGLLDLQVNGYAGVDFNDPALTAKMLDHAFEAMLADGVTGCLPTIITVSPNDLRDRFRAVDDAVSKSRLGLLDGPRLPSGRPFPE
jgi:N-acetylglucosamine-6-phosphate deacetylase